MMNKIIVVGPSGAGKSTFSRKLAKKLNIPLYCLDNIFWNENKEHVTKEKFDVILDAIIKNDKWIIDGDYSRTYDIRMQNCDTIFFLDYSLDTCLKGANSRVGTKREDCPFIENEVDEEFKEWIINWSKDIKPVLMEKLKQYKDKNIIIFKDRDEANLYLTNAIKNEDNPT